MNMRLSSGLVLLIVILTACATQRSDDRDDCAHIADRNAELRQQVADLEKLHALQRSQLDQARVREGASEERIAKLQREIASLKHAERDPKLLDEQIMALQGELGNAQLDAEQARSESRRLERSLADLSEELSYYRSSENEMAAEGGGHEAAYSREPGSTPNGEDVVWVPDETTGARRMTVFYGTNRARLDNTWKDYLKPFIWPLVIAILCPLLTLLIRWLIKTRFQRGGVISARVVCALVCGALVLSGIFEVVQLREADTLNPVQYGPYRLEVASGELPFELGTCIVSVPPVHERGVVELPEVTVFEFRSDPRKHFVLSEITPSDDSAQFFEQLQLRVKQSSDRDLFVFVHGFHNTFQDAAFRTAQIAHDLDFPGAPVFFSWPAQGGVLDYTTDENNVRVAVDDLRKFLQQLKANSQAKRIHLIAHSMGSRALTRAIKDIGAEMQGEDSIFNEMILAAPDIDAEELDQMADRIAKAVDRVTLYASSKDEALSASRFVHGQTYQRAGETIPQPMVNKAVETIDVSEVTAGHSYIADSGRVLSDLNDILTKSRKLDEGIAERIPVEEGSYWVLR